MGWLHTAHYWEKEEENEGEDEEKERKKEKKKRKAGDSADFTLVYPSSTTFSSFYSVGGGGGIIGWPLLGDRRATTSDSFLFFSFSFCGIVEYLFSFSMVTRQGRK